jgi:hypothetical protein
MDEFFPNGKGWTDGRMDGRTDGLMDGRTDGRTEGGTDGRMDGRTDGRRDGWMDGFSRRSVFSSFVDILHPRYFEGVFQQRQLWFFTKIFAPLP